MVKPNWDEARTQNFMTIAWYYCRCVHASPARGSEWKLVAPLFTESKKTKHCFRTASLHRGRLSGFYSQACKPFAASSPETMSCCFTEAARKNDHRFLFSRRIGLLSVQHREHGLKWSRRCCSLFSPTRGFPSWFWLMLSCVQTIYTIRVCIILIVVWFLVNVLHVALGHRSLFALRIGVLSVSMSSCAQHVVNTLRFRNLAQEGLFSDYVLIHALFFPGRISS